MGWSALLHRVRQLVREQALAVRPFGGVPASAEYDVICACVSVCAECAGGFGGILVVMDAHKTKIEAKAWFEESPRGLLQRLTGRT
jgi:hypothetical protein